MDVFRIHKEWVDEKVVGLRDRCVGGCVCGFIGMWGGVCVVREELVLPNFKRFEQHLEHLEPKSIK